MVLALRKFLRAVVGMFLLGVAVMALAGPATAAPAVGPAPAPFTPRRQISVNQSGYYSHAPKVAVLVSDSQTPLAWTLKDGSGQTVLTGETAVKGPDAASGDAVHWIDFSAYVTPGKGYTLAAESQISDPFEIGATNYGALKTDALRYFYLNRSDMALEQQYAEALALPSQAAVEVALRTQQIIAYESGVADTVDPLAGSYAIEALTDEIERRATQYIADRHDGRRAQGDRGRLHPE